ncbi:hypothetical protein [Cupriavidus oxalaticus]|uniref:Uncharacterized protein n=1 Tax=Cupriavidus oxalaticus TaxID=96344 RepID=A0A4P7LIV7_9BURK|nr:hypothetical protein [Cupriavidus oxalaticus]QBY55518.1 hypothetical protein E0W60_31385 [Cupriavidus oxalaticus]
MLGEATRIQKGVRDSLKLHQQVRELKEELRKAYSELDRYRQTHARAVTNVRQFERETTAQASMQQAQIESLLLRYRIYKLMTEHYALTALRLDPATLVTHRDRVAQHVLFRRKKGVSVPGIGLGDLGLELL